MNGKVGITLAVADHLGWDLRVLPGQGPLVYAKLAKLGGVISNKLTRAMQKEQENDSHLRKANKRQKPSPESQAATEAAAAAAVHTRARQQARARPQYMVRSLRRAHRGTMTL